MCNLWINLCINSMVNEMTCVMSKIKRSWSKRSLVTVLSLGFMVLGIGCISWTVFSISRYSIPASSAAEPKKLPEVSTAPAESVPSPVLPVPAKAVYPIYPVEGDSIGTLTIPALKLELPILQGTEEKELKKGVGHFLQSVLPGEEDNCVLSGHRETVFRQLGKLEIGYLLIVQTSAGTFTYEVKGTRIVDEDDKTVIVPTDNAVLTLTTCYPFDTPGYFPCRYIVSATLVESK